MFVLARRSPAPPHLVWSVIADFREHGRYVPATTIQGAPGPIGLGWTFDAVTGVGPLAVHDLMTVTAWEPDRHFRIEKHGRLLRGWTELSLVPDGSGTAVVWTQQIHLRGLPPGSARLSDVVSRLGYQHSLDAMLAEAAARMRSAS